MVAAPSPYGHLGADVNKDEECHEDDWPQLDDLPDFTASVSRYDRGLGRPHGTLDSDFRNKV